MDRNYICETNEMLKRALSENAQHGFDLTLFNSDKDFIKILKALKIKPVAKLDKSAYAYVWKGPGITIYTGNNPITGEYSEPERRQPEKGYASYIGIEGKEELVAKAAELINKYAKDIKDESPGSRDFI